MFRANASLTTTNHRDRGWHWQYVSYHNNHNMRLRLFGLDEEGSGKTQPENRNELQPNVRPIVLEMDGAPFVLSKTVVNIFEKPFRRLLSCAWTFGFVLGRYVTSLTKRCWHQKTRLLYYRLFFFCQPPASQNLVEVLISVISCWLGNRGCLCSPLNEGSKDVTDFSIVLFGYLRGEETVVKRYFVF